MKTFNPTPSQRRYAYGIANAALALAVGYNLMDGNESALWLLFINATLGMAQANVEPSE